MRAFQRPWRWSLLGALFAALLASGPAQAANAEGTLDMVRQRLDAVQKTLSNPPTTIDLAALRADTTAIGADADAAGLWVQPQLASAQARLDQLGASSAGEPADIATLRATLERSRTAWLTQARFASLLSLESAQSLRRIEALRRARAAASLGTRIPSILASAFWSELRGSAGPEADRLAALGTELAGAAMAVPVTVGAAVAACIVGLVMFGRWAGGGVQRLATTVVPPGRLRRSFDAWASIAIRVAVPGLIGLALWVGVGWSGALSPTTESLLEGVLHGICFAAYGFAVGRALLCADRPSWRLLAPLPDGVAHGLRHFPAGLAAVVLVGWLTDRLAASLDSSDAITVAVRCIATLLLGLGVVWAQMRGEHLRRHHADDDAVGADGVDANRRPLWAASLAAVVWLGMAASVLCLLLGYVALGSLVIQQFAWIGLVVGTAYLFNALIEDASNSLIATARTDDDKDDDRTAQEIARAGLRDQAAVLLAGGIKVAVFAVAALLIVTPVGESPAELLRRALLWGGDWSLGEVKVRPRAVIEALVVLVLGLLAVTAVKRWLAVRYLPTTKLDKDVQASTVTMFGYAGAVAAVIMALSASGLGLDRVAWIASALSVGIGFGLQGVTQNFISGLILLAERPIKVGDWVSLGDVEGDIRRINLRATEVQLGDRSTMIVPNSEFITKAVRNVTHGSPLGLVQIKLPMPLDTDVDQVRAMLLDAYSAHADLLAEPAPAVHLAGIDSDHLVFNATGFVATPRLVYAVRSSVLSDLLKRLREAGVPMAARPTLLLRATDGAGGPDRTDASG